jgi:hypothetical protein
MSKSEIDTYKEIIRIFEETLVNCKDYSDREYYTSHIERFKKKIKELGGEV